MSFLLELFGRKGFKAFVGYSLFFLGALITFGSILIAQEKVISSNTVHGTSYISQLAKDWEQAPLTDIKIVESTVCPTGYTDMYA